MRHTFTTLMLLFALAVYGKPIKSVIGVRNLFSTEEDTEAVHLVEYIQTTYHSGSWLRLPPPPQTCSFDFSITYCLTMWDAYTGLMGLKGDYPEGVYAVMFQFIPENGIIDYPDYPWSYNRIYLSSLNDRKWHNITMANGILTVDYEKTYSGNNSFKAASPLVGFGLFAACTYLGNRTEGNAEMMVSEFSYTVDGVLSFDGVAVRFKNEEGKWEAGLLDQLTGEIYKNAGTGTMLYGPDK